MVMHELLRRTDVERITGLSRSALYQKVKDGEFPRQVKISDNAVGWVAAEVNAWVEARIAARDGVA